MPDYDLVTLGETMLRLAPGGSLRLEQASQLAMSYGGTESNVACALARLGKRVAWYSRLPDNPLGKQCASVLRAQQVDTRFVDWDAEARMGVYFVEFGTKPRGIRVWYDRANSAASHMTPADLPAEMITGAGWLHLTGITPALSPSCQQATVTALKLARDHDIPVSFDVNYRALLWDHQTAGAVLDPFCHDATTVFVALRDAVNLWGAPDEAESAAQELQTRWGGTVIITRGDAGAVACDGATLTAVGGMDVQIVDRVGAGDAFAAGVLCRLLEDAPLEDALRFGTAVAALALSIEGDIAYVTRDEVENLLNSGGDSLTR